MCIYIYIYIHTYIHIIPLRDARPPTDRHPVECLDLLLDPGAVVPIVDLYVCVCIYIYIYIEREREIDR